MFFAVFSLVDVCNTVELQQETGHVHILSIGYAPFFSEHILLYRVTQTSSLQKTIISKAAKSGYKDVTVCSLGPWDFPVQLTKQYCNDCKVVSPNLVHNPVQYKSAAVISQSFIVHS